MRERRKTSLRANNGCTPGYLHHTWAQRGRMSCTFAISSRVTDTHTVDLFALRDSNGPRTSDLETVSKCLTTKRMQISRRREARRSSLVCRIAAEFSAVMPFCTASSHRPWYDHGGMYAAQGKNKTSVSASNSTSWYLSCICFESILYQLAGNATTVL